MNISNQITSSKVLYALLGLSLLFFLIKGIIYALIGSYVPILFILVMIIILSWGFNRCSKVHLSIIRFWGILLIIWGIIRLGLGGYLQFDTNLTESHLREQFGLFQNLVSIGMLVIGIKLFREIKKTSQHTSNR
mgnify:CR=1 FL=1